MFYVHLPVVCDHVRAEEGDGELNEVITWGVTGTCLDGQLIVAGKHRLAEVFNQENKKSKH